MSPATFATLLPPLRSPEPPAAGSGLAHAEAAALAERVLQSFQTSADGRPRAHLRLAGPLAGIEVRLELEGARVRTELVLDEDVAPRAASDLRDALRRELTARGLDGDITFG